MSNKNTACIGCKYNTPKTQGGVGMVCNGFTQPVRCPEWAINEYHQANPSLRNFKQSMVTEFMKVK